MLYNSDQFGGKKDIITDSVFNYFNFDEGFIPPPENDYRITSFGDIRQTSGGDLRVTADSI